MLLILTFYAQISILLHASGCDVAFSATGGEVGTLCPFPKDGEFAARCIGARVQEHRHRFVQLVCLPVVTYLGRAVDSYISYTETTASRAVHIPEQTVTGPTSPLWFFAAQPDGQDQDVLRRGDIPWRFWSSEKDPECVPEGIVFDPTPQYERVDENTLALLSTWTQTIGDVTLTIKTKYALREACANIAPAALH